MTNIFKRVQGKNQITESLDFEELDGFQDKIKPSHFPYSMGAQYFLAVCIGIATSAMVLFSFYTTSYLESWRKLIYQNYLIRQQNLSQGFIYLLLFCMGFGVIGTIMVLFVPVAPGGGMPEVICYMNGIKMKSYTGIRTFVLKTLSMIMTNSSGLFTGYDGPLIHNALIMCHHIVLFFGKFPGFLFGEKYTDRQSRPSIIASRLHRLQIKMGIVYVAANIAAGFKSPMGGLAFALEEAMTYFEPTMLLLCLVGSTSAYLMTNIIQRFNDNGLVLESNTFAFLPTDAICTHAPEYLDILVSYIPMGLFMGVVGAGKITIFILAYTKGVISFLKISDKYLANIPYYRILEVLLAIFLTTAVTVFLPWYVGDPCIPYNDAISQLQLLSECRYTCGPKGEFCFNRICLPDVVEQRYRLENKAFFLQAGNTCLTNPALNLAYPAANTLSVLSPFKLPQRFVQDSANRCYYQFASLFLHTPDQVLRNIVTRGAYELFTDRTLIAFLVVYILLSILAYDTLLPTDLSFPNIIIGAALGRLWGIYMNFFKMKYDLMPIDPGVYGIVGAAGFLSGTFRLCLTMAVVMTESTMDLSYMIPILIVSITATLTGNWFGMGEFHEEINLNRFPFLRFYPPTNLEYQKLSDIMTPAKQIVYLSEKEVVWSLFRKLRRTDYTGFPVLSDGKVIGLVQRCQLKKILKCIKSLNDDEEVALFGVSPEGIPSDTAPLDSNISSSILDKLESFNGEEKLALDKNTKILNIGEMMIKPVFTVSEEMNAQKAYGIFKNVGLRTMCVVNEKGDFSGIVTRKDLLFRK